jgi:hypothetical protein
MRVNMVNDIRKLIGFDKTLADSDVDLIWNIWARQVAHEIPIDRMQAKMLMKMWKDGKISSPFNISRSRRKCQELYPETRGQIYEKRQKHQNRIIEDVQGTTHVPGNKSQVSLVYGTRKTLLNETV